MVTILPLKKMSRRDKLRVMEELWVDLSTNAEVDSPAWHGAELRRTEQLVESGAAKFDDWGKARQRLRRQISRRL
ncbi:MAG: addiction module protein [Verrucomicrobiales bacterium]|jgi:hypothetical protein|nr:addiction module protein [Verrucomicrobiales bacterium]